MSKRQRDMYSVQFQLTINGNINMMYLTSRPEAFACAAKLDTAMILLLLLLICLMVYIL